MLKVAEPPPFSPSDRGRVAMLFHFARLQLPAVRLAESSFQEHLRRTFGMYLPKLPAVVPWAAYLEGLYTIDWAVCVGCLDRQSTAWEMLFAARTGRSDVLLVDALRGRAARLYPRDEEKQDTAVTEFWTSLIVPETEASVPILARYDGQRPLAPWLIRVFQNWHLSKLRQHSGLVALPDDEIALPMDSGHRPENMTVRWHETFIQAARDWLGSIGDEERLLLGLRWRYRMSQRDVANLFGINEGNISRRTDKLRNGALEMIKERLIDDGWTGDDIEGFILTELGALLTDDPRLSAEQLARILAKKGKSLPAAT